ncbi:transposase [Microcystis aeruginosa NIES-3806]|uniref:Transposase n=3 Tax=Microcystis aeruginosa TaxID=1126 RepID=A0A6H9G4P5_MICAE|nr:hypothetical protein MiTs_01746 [Microcystis aeruginosa NIES-2521]GCL44334.1 transposase [Microcystis aeruginosa NIES-3787]GCL52945.1 transposase [Microcystis aeruginosa NIES-3806]GCL60101.1 transposase [Microcystis aeruginosa NIES-3807]
MKSDQNINVSTLRRSSEATSLDVEYKLTGYKLSDERRKIRFTDGFNAGEFDLWCSQKTLVYYSEQQIKRVRIVRRADGYYLKLLSRK